jgi:hypothetical protein
VSLRLLSELPTQRKQRDDVAENARGTIRVDEDEGNDSLIAGNRSELDEAHHEGGDVGSCRFAFMNAAEAGISTRIGGCLRPGDLNRDTGATTYERAGCVLLIGAASGELLANHIFQRGGEYR